MATETTDLAAARAALDELAALRDKRAALILDLIHVARTSHQAHHADHSGTWLSCDRGLCPGLRRAVSRARGEG